LIPNTANILLQQDRCEPGPTASDAALGRTGEEHIMKKITFALALGSMACSTGASAQSVEEGAESKGECKRWINWDRWYASRGLPNPVGEIPPNARCERGSDGRWYLVAG
jgi:hypothetical protein